MKGLQDPYRNPTTQQCFAERWGQNAAMVTSFADGSKISFEQSIVANATGFKVRSRGMSRGRPYTGDVLKIGELYDVEELRKLGGAFDYVVGTPLTKVYSPVNAAIVAIGARQMVFERCAVRHFGGYGMAFG